MGQLRRGRIRNFAGTKTGHCPTVDPRGTLWAHRQTNKSANGAPREVRSRTNTAHNPDADQGQDADGGGLGPGESPEEPTSEENQPRRPLAMGPPGRRIPSCSGSGASVLAQHRPCQLLKPASVLPGGLLAASPFLVTSSNKTTARCNSTRPPCGCLSLEGQQCE